MVDADFRKIIVDALEIHTNEATSPDYAGWLKIYARVRAHREALVVSATEDIKRYKRNLDRRFQKRLAEAVERLSEDD